MAYDKRMRYGHKHSRRIERIRARQCAFKKRNGAGGSYCARKRFVFGAAAAYPQDDAGIARAYEAGSGCGLYERRFGFRRYKAAHRAFTRKRRPVYSPTYAGSAFKDAANGYPRAHKKFSRLKKRAFPGRRKTARRFDPARFKRTNAYKLDPRCVPQQL